MQFTHLSKYLKEIEERLTIQYADTLFPLDWKALCQGRCPMCGCKLYQTKPLEYGAWICKSKKHKTFAISHKSYQQLSTELGKTEKSLWYNSQHDWPTKKIEYYGRQGRTGQSKFCPADHSIQGKHSLTAVFFV